MQYSSIKTKKEDTLRIPSPHKGLNLSNKYESAEKGYLLKGENLCPFGSFIKTRPGFVGGQETLIKTQLEGSAGKHKVNITDISYYHDGEYKKLFYETFYYDNSGYAVCVYLLGKSGGVTDASYLYFGRVDDSTFFVPENILFYVGKPQNGGGIFALVSLENEENTIQKEYRIYEINSSLDGWSLACNYYIPTAYINGRGNAYDVASQTSNANFKGEPQELEAPNLLDGSFYAYFSSDSYSYSFRLPFSNLADDTVACRVYRTPEEYTDWVIAASETDNTQTFLSSEVTAHVDRAKGIVSFRVEAGTYNIPAMNLYAENNIRFMAKVDINDGKSEVISSSCTATIGSRILFSGGIAKNKLFYTRYDNPLYFPRNTDDFVGFSDTPVTALVPCGQNVIALKPQGIYKISIKKGGSFNNTEILTDNDRLFFKNDNFDIKCIDTTVGCENKKTVKNDSQRIFWLGSDNIFYSMNTSGNITDNTKLVKPIFQNLTLEENENASLTCCGEYCLLSLGNKSVIINKDNLAMFSWKLPEGFNTVGGVDFNGKNLFVCENNNENSFFIVTLQPDRGMDVMVTRGTNVTYKINSELETPEYFLNGIKRKSRIKKVFLRLFSTEKIEIRITVGRNNFKDFVIDKAEFSRDGQDLIKLFCNIDNAEFFKLSIQSKDVFSLGDIEVQYSNNI